MSSKYPVGVWEAPSALVKIVAQQTGRRVTPSLGQRLWNANNDVPGLVNQMLRSQSIFE